MELEKIRIERVNKWLQIMNRAFAFLQEQRDASDERLQKAETERDEARRWARKLVRKLDEARARIEADGEKLEWFACRWKEATDDRV